MQRAYGRTWAVLSLPLQFCTSGQPCVQIVQGTCARVARAWVSLPLLSSAAPPLGRSTPPQEAWVDLPRARERVPAFAPHRPRVESHGAPSRRGAVTCSSTSFRVDHAGLSSRVDHAGQSSRVDHAVQPPHGHVLVDEVDARHAPLPARRAPGDRVHVRVDVPEVVEDVGLAREHHRRRLKARPDVDDQDALPRDPQRVAHDAAARAARHLVHPVHHRREVAALGLPPVLGVALHEPRLRLPQPRDCEHLFGRVHADDRSRRLLQAQGAADPRAQGHARGGREAYSAAQVDHLRFLRDNRRVYDVPHVDARVGKAIDGVRRNRHHHRVQQASPADVAKVVDPRVVPVAV
mmetsp:Transcript_29419/g.80716  ORF Transcript_29419/g.80716 Transcript_29419/m.80716 type:complete len:349 (-) Transcript_29419:267-1313(-)